ncbi:MAG: hypothetical protein HVN35_02935 [Methanobacteriaceae archaeon]|nr:hypothetical protein [Methanobacteriaceae archaeon]
MKIEDYHKIIEDIYDTNLEADSIADSRRILVELTEKEMILKDLKKSVRRDIKNIQMAYLERKRQINTDYAGGRSPGVVSRFRGKSKIKELKKLDKERDESLKDYEEVKYLVDDLILQIEKAKEPLNNYIKKKLFGV